MPNRALDCRRTHELLSPFVDGELALDLARSVLVHLERCAQCRTAADDLRSLGGVVRELEQASPTGLGARILSEVRADRERAPRPILRFASAWSRMAPGFAPNVAPKLAAMLVGAASVALLLAPPEASSTAGVGPRSSYHLLVAESQAQVELAGSFDNDLRVLVARPEGRLLYDLTGGR